MPGHLCTNFLVLWYMVDVKFLKFVGQFNCCLVVGYEGFMSNLILSCYLVDDEFRVAVRLETFHP